MERVSNPMVMRTKRQKGMCWPKTIKSAHFNPSASAKAPYDARFVSDRLFH
jgi:hypothetical protein